ncbi:hypothetical protein ACHAWF_014139 [Thalassiosira exigua]
MFSFIFRQERIGIMGKSKSSKGGKKGGEAAKKCTCDHPYQCSCDNRPERPSKGHKWDPETQQWGGKGHKQKGASGQTASVAQADKVTSVGNTVLKQWQKLPTRLLSDLCKKNGKALGKGMPIYRPIRGAGAANIGKYRFRLIIPDTSKKGSSEHDIILAPSLSVSNEEQAKEEAALLGLLYLFPKLPHERTLPEPYRSTYLAALKKAAGKDGEEGAKGCKKAGIETGTKPNVTKRIDSTTQSNAEEKSTAKLRDGGGATANAQLTAKLPSFHVKKNKINNGKASSSTPQQPLLTRAQINEARKQHQREVQSRIRKHEAIRNANKPMEVFMSARFRRRIECLLEGGVFGDKDNELFLEEEEDHAVDTIDEDKEDVVRSYVHQRLVHEGFTSSQVLKAYRAVASDGISGKNSQDEEQMDKMYEETLQYLCIHLKEDQLPPGFDPRGGTLDVIRPTSIGENGTKGKHDTKRTHGKRNNEQDVNYGREEFGENIIQIADLFGLTPKEAFAIHSLSRTDDTKHTFWKILADCSSLPLERTCFSTHACQAFSDEDKQRNEEAAALELEALAAIFEPDDVSVQKEDTTTTVFIALPLGDWPKLTLEVHYANGAYPDLLPMAFVTSGNENGNPQTQPYRCGGNVHLKLAGYMSDMTPGEVIFELFGHVQSLLQDEAESPDSPGVSLLLSRLKLDKDDDDELSKASEPIENDPAENAKEKSSLDERQPPKKQQSKPSRRPRERSTFWNTHPHKTPSAYAPPKLSAMLERARKSLPAAKAKGEFLSLMAEAKAAGGRVVLVTGETGCGKTTQIPQFILEDSPKEAKIIVAQPRRLAATGVASRVSLERGEPNPGTGSVGYVVRGDSKMCPSTRLMFCTTGVLLRQLQSDKALDVITHILIDEVHERHLDTDVLLAILKQTLPSLPNLSVVLMSATMDADRFAKYWGESTPRMHIPGFTHPVKDRSLEDVLELTCYIPPKKKKKQQQRGRSYQIQPSFVDGDDYDDDEDRPLDSGPSLPLSCPVPLEERLKRMTDEIDYDLIAVLIKSLLQSKEDDGSILVFLPGAGEIDQTERAIHRIVKGHAMTILPLHGGLQPERQQQVFIPAKKGFTKVILSTNVAETSITIPDCTVVVDTCKEKQSSFDPVNRMPLLLERFASRDSLKQRRGRAGRVRPGTCYKLISKTTHNKLPEHGEPEIRRCALDQVILSLLFLGLENGTGNFLRLMLDPPSQKSIDSALYSLEKTGALYREGNLAFLTPLGSHLSGIPAPPAVGKLLVMGTLLGCRDIAVAIAAGLSAGRSPFLRINTPFKGKPQNNNNDMDQEKEISNTRILEERTALFKMVGNSDHVMRGKAFLLWKECRGASERKQFCDKMGLSFNGMREILSLTRQLDSSLTTSGFRPSNECNRNQSSWRIVRSMIVASLSPTQVVRVQRPSTKYTETVEGSIEKEGKAKELKFFIRGGIDNVSESKGEKNISGSMNQERVFIHPSSNNFVVGSYSCPWLVYHRLVRTSKPFVSDATECNPYALLLFGGSMEVQASKGLIVLDDWIRLSANARIGSLIGGLRQKVDELLMQKVANPSLDITSASEMNLITDLLRHDGI